MRRRRAQERPNLRPGVWSSACSGWQARRSRRRRAGSVSIRGSAAHACSLLVLRSAPGGGAMAKLEARSPSGVADRFSPAARARRGPWRRGCGRWRRGRGPSRWARACPDRNRGRSACRCRRQGRSRSTRRRRRLLTPRGERPDFRKITELARQGRSDAQVMQAGRDARDRCMAGKACRPVDHRPRCASPQPRNSHRSGPDMPTEHSLRPVFRPTLRA